MKTKYRIKIVEYKNGKTDYIPQEIWISPKLWIVIIFMPFVLCVSIISLLSFVDMLKEHIEFKETFCYDFHKRVFHQFKRWHEIKNDNNFIFDLKGYSMIRARFLIDERKRIDTVKYHTWLQKELKKEEIKKASKVKEIRYIR